jgi:predicted XRE-type DNA-binding protein
MVNYTGNISLQSAQPEAVIDTVIQKAKAKGGHVSHQRNGFVTLQIPVAEFKTFFDYILTLGQVTSKNIFARDITDAYTDNAERLRIAETTMARLQQLLASAKSEQEKIALLKEIQRVSEQIEQAKLTEKELLRLAAFSTIHLNVSNIPLPVVRRMNIVAFEWFSLLPNSVPSRKAFKLNVPKDFVKIRDTRREWKAASALYTELWGFERENEPQGTIDFWANAMLNFFKSRYKTELKTEESFSLIRLETSDSEPMVYYIAILKESNKKDLKIALAKFPSREAEKKDSEAIKESLRRAK